MSENNFSRRKFLAGAAAVGAAGTMGIGALSSCTTGGGGSETAGTSAGASVDWPPREYKYPPMVDAVPEGKVLTAGVIGWWPWNRCCRTIDVHCGTAVYCGNGIY